MKTLALPARSACNIPGDYRRPYYRVARFPTASALGLLTIEQQLEEIVVIPARGFPLAFDSRLDGSALAQQGQRQPLEQRPVCGPVAVALPHPAWVEYKKRTGKVITDSLAIEIAGHFLKTALESGEGLGREMYSLTIDETLKHLEDVVSEVESPVATTR